MNLSSARKARRSNGAGHVETQDYECPAQATREAVVAPHRQRPSAAVGVPLVEAHLCAGHRRPEGRNAGFGFLAGEVDARKRIEFLTGLNGQRREPLQGKSFKDRKTPWQVNANAAVAATGAAGKSAT